MFNHCLSQSSYDKTFLIFIYRLIDAKKINLSLKSLWSICNILSESTSCSYSRRLLSVLAA